MKRATLNGCLRHIGASSKFPTTMGCLGLSRLQQHVHSSGNLGPLQVHTGSNPKINLIWLETKPGEIGETYFLFFFVFLWLCLLRLGHFVLRGSCIFSFAGSWLLTGLITLRCILFLHERFVLPGPTDCWHESSCKNQLTVRILIVCPLYSEPCAPVILNNQVVFKGKGLSIICYYWSEISGHLIESLRLKPDLQLNRTGTAGPWPGAWGFCWGLLGLVVGSDEVQTQRWLSSFYHLRWPTTSEIGS